jgi:DNA processing protein
MTPTDANPEMPPRQDAETLKAWQHLANAQFGPRLLASLLRRFGANPQAILDATDAELDEVPEMQSRHLVRLRDVALRPTPRQIAWLERPDLQILWLGHPSYPRPLEEIPDPPALLFVRGQLSEVDRFGVGIVGSRHATPYGRSVAERLARELTGHGLTIVSGGAVGIDASAHRGAMTAGGRTLALLGCGLDVDYPRENRALFEQIAKQGAMISEYPLGAQPESWRFPLRNRLISGMAMGIVVIEAPQASGALITARYAAEHGRPVMAVPGNIDRESSRGTNALLKDGALMITECRDILTALGMVVLPARPEHQRTFDLGWEAEETPATNHATASPAAAPAAPAHLTPAQQQLITALSLTPRHIDALAHATGMTATTASVEMTLLELTGLVRRLPGNTYIRSL